jgi:hypothetical protein
MEFMAKIMAEAVWPFELHLGDTDTAFLALSGMGL